MARVVQWQRQDNLITDMFDLNSKLMSSDFKRSVSVTMSSFLSRVLPSLRLGKQNRFGFGWSDEQGTSPNPKLFLWVGESDQPDFDLPPNFVDSNLIQTWVNFGS